MKLRIVEVPYRYDDATGSVAGRGRCSTGLVDRLQDTPVGTPDVVTASCRERAGGRPRRRQHRPPWRSVGASSVRPRPRRAGAGLAGDDTAAVGVVSVFSKSRRARRIGVVWFMRTATSRHRSATFSLACRDPGRARRTALARGGDAGRDNPNGPNRRCRHSRA